MGITKDRNLIYNSKVYLIIWIIILISFNLVAQTKDKKDVLATENKINAFSFGYQTAFFYDPNTSIFFPFGLNAEYKFGRKNSSLDLQILIYHPNARHDEQIGYYQFLTEYFVQYDLGIRFYLDQRNVENTGYYFRPSVGISTKYYRSVTHNYQQNLGLEVSRLLGKEFIGMQFGYKGKISKLIYANAAIGTLTSFFYNSNKIFILFSPNISLSLGASF